MSEAQRLGPALINGYSAASNTGFHEWVLKSCTNDGDPPKAKHVRRVLLSLIRSPQITLANICTAVFTDQTWRRSPFISAKALYLVLTCAQQVETSKPIKDIVEVTDRVCTLYQNTTFEGVQHQFSTICQATGSIIHTKNLFQLAFPSIDTNFHMKNEDNIQKPQLIEQLKGYLTKVCYEGNRALTASGDNLTLIILSQPIIEEVCNAYMLLRYLDGSESHNVRDAEMLIQRAKECQFLKTAIIYPPPSVVQPPTRFPKFD